MSMICSSFLRSNMWTALQSQFWESLYIKKFLGTLWSMDTCARGTCMSDTCRTWTCIGHVPKYVGHSFDCVLLFYGYFLAEKKRLGSNLSYNPVLLCQTKSFTSCIRGSVSALFVISEQWWLRLLLYFLFPSAMAATSLSINLEPTNLSFPSCFVILCGIWA